MFSKNMASPMVLIALGCGMVIALSLVMLTYEALIQQKSDVYNARILLLKEQVVRKIDGIDEVAHGMRSLFDASSEVDSDEFRLLTDNLLSRHSHIFSTSYLPRVKRENISRFEKQIQEKGFINFSVRTNEVMEHDAMAERLEFYPVLYHEPFTPVSIKKMGLDYASYPEINLIIKRAVETSMAAASIHAPLSTKDSEYVVVKAIYAGKDTPSTLEERRATVNGLISMRVDARAMFSLDSMSEFSVRLMLEREGNEQNLVDIPYREGDHGIFPPRWLEQSYVFFSGVDEYKLRVKAPVYIDRSDYIILFAALLLGGFISWLIYLQARNIVERTAFLQRRHQEIQAYADERTKELAHEKERAQITLESIEDAVITTDAEGIVDYLNPIAEKLTGWSEEEAIGQRVDCIFSLVDEEKNETLDNPVLECLRQSAVIRIRETVFLVDRKNNKISAEVTAAPIMGKDNKVLGAVFVSHDVSVAKQLASQMEFQATHDSLTSLPNRVLLIDRLNQAISRAPWNKRHIAVLFLDLDRFKLVNDTLGHDVGDELLEQVANRLLCCLRKGDTVSRLGGDEFVVVLQDLASPEDVHGIAEKIIDVFKRPFQLSVEEFFTTSSVGISLYPGDGDDPHILMKKADSAMYQAKAAGKNKFVFYDDRMSEHNTKKLTIEMELRRALDREEFSLFYQPQVDARTGKMIGAEALIRWNHPEWGLVSPMDFIPIAEETGLIIPIGNWVIQTACEHRKIWYELGHKDIRVSVNISGVQFQHGSLLPVVKRALEDTAISADLLELELTEGVLAKDSENAATTLAKLKAMGVHMSIDDFGTGYSSLSYLKRFPVSTLKVDRCFVKDVITDPDDAAICTAIIAMAHNLNLRVIAEGVENNEQLEFLLSYNCDAIQGYYFSPPVNEAKFRSLLINEESQANETR